MILASMVDPRQCPACSERGTDRLDRLDRGDHPFALAAFDELEVDARAGFESIQQGFVGDLELHGHPGHFRLSIGPCSMLTVPPFAS
jgi:hypothetical protein